MAVYAFAGSFLLTLAFILREIQASRDRSALMEAYEHLRVAHNATRRRLLDLGDHIAVLQAMLYERKHITQHEFLKARTQWDHFQKNTAQKATAAPVKNTAHNLRLVGAEHEEISSPLA
jgi:hypothetical protein